MKKLVATVLVLGLASTTFGATLGWQIGATTGTVGTDPTTGAPKVTLAPSDTAVLQLYLFNATSGLFNAYAGITAQDEAGFNLDDVLPGPGLTFDTLSSTLAPGQPIDGKEFQVYETNFYGFPDPGDYLLMELLIHCSSPNTFTVVSLNNIGGAAGVTDVNFVDYPAADLNYAGAIVVIEQIPEPASLALLALGGLALIRRR